MFVVDVRSRIDLISGGLLLLVELEAKHVVAQEGGTIVCKLCLGMLKLGGSDATRRNC